jgi:D-arabinose 1-dehydrogenase-like Zn-dependent alcohol dehydrogenase
VLEIGGGGTNSRLLAMAKWMGADVTALDYSKQGLDVIQRLFAYNDAHGNFVLGVTCSPISRRL